ncbi:DndE family protein [uncultured Tenacibaculum sp.]|uniref:DndE family protein n=1 Tax=uncultured Tenacibaculum sp. TaxID=174713 RepID=UPI0026382AEA|nr:DndE family protein [uncultured Tenacibaculum sp.]
MRIKISKESDDILYKIKTLYNFKNDGIAPRIAFSYSIMTGKEFDVNNDLIPSSDGKEFRDDRALFGTIVNDSSNFIIYKASLDQHYNKNIFDDEFSKLFKLHLNHGLNLISDKIDKCNISNGEHISFIISLIKKGLSFRKNIVKVGLNTTKKTDVKEFKNPLSFCIGNYEDGTDVEIKINDLREFDNRNIAIAGMAGSGKTQLIKDILFQISKKTENSLKFIFFDYKGEGNPEQLKPFLKNTNCEFIDIVNDGGIDFNPFSSINLEERQRPFSISAFVDTIATFVPSVGVSQKNILKNIITDLFDEKGNSYPTINELFERLDEYYEETKRKPDTLYAGIQDLTSNIFNCNDIESNILDKSIYLNLPPALSDTLRQLVVFLLLRYFNTFFSSTNDCKPNDYIFPLRYVMVIDEAHIYLKNKNARKALEELLRLLRSKGVIIVMLSQGVEDYKTKDFDFASQVKLPICLNVQNKDYKMITSFLGTPSSKYKLETEINKLESGKGLLNINDPKTIELRQFWKTIEKERL